MKIHPLLLAVALTVATAPLLPAHPIDPSALPAADKEALRQRIADRFMQSATARKWFKTKPENPRPISAPRASEPLAAVSGFDLATLFSVSSASPPAGNGLLMQASFAPFKPKVRFNWDTHTFYLESDNTPDGMPNRMVGITAWQQQIPLPAAYFASSTNNENNSGSLGFGQPNYWRLPLVPTPAATPTLIFNPGSTTNNFQRGAIALASNGIAIFNPANNRGEVSYEIGELDYYGGHCGLADDYHYHIIPMHLSNRFGGPLGDDKPVAWALDGYPIYGYLEPDGTARQALDSNGGHDHGGWGYHYHAIGNTTVDATHPYGTPQTPYTMTSFRGTVVNFGGQVDGQPSVASIRADGTGGYNAKAIPGASIVALINPAALTTDGSGHYIENTAPNAPTSPDAYIMRVNIGGTNYDECWTINRKANPRTLTVTWRAQALVSGQLSGPIVTTTNTYTPTAGTASGNRLTAYPMGAWSEAKIPDTGQVISTTTTFGEDSDYPGNAQSFADNGNGTITDQVTGLMWQKTDNGESTWENAVLNASSVTTGGYNDWRLPSPAELFSIFNHENNGVSLNTTYFPQNGAGAQYWWTRDVYGSSTTNVWCANEGGGLGGKPKSETTSAGGSFRYHARYVRGGQNSNSHNYVNNLDGTITDTDTSLMWTQIPAPASTWEAALTYAENHDHAGYTDWRLPDIKELQTLTDYSLTTATTTVGIKPSINRTMFAKTLTNCTVNTTSGLVTCDDTSGLLVGMPVVDPYSVASTYLSNTTAPTITQVNSPTSFTLSATPSNSASGLKFRALALPTAYWSSTSLKGDTTKAWLLEAGINTSVPAASGPPRGSQGIISYEAKTSTYPVFVVRTAVVNTQIAVEQPTGTALTDGISIAAYGNVNVGSTASKTFTIRNNGTSSLTITGATIDGLHASLFTVTSSPAGSIASGGSTTMTVQFQASSVGTKTATLHLASSDSAVGTAFDINLSGTGYVPPPAISNIAINPISPTSSDPATVTAQVTPGNGATISGVTLTYDLGAQVTAPAFREIFGNANANGLGGSLNTWTTTTVRAAGDIRQRGATGNRTVPIVLTNCATNNTTAVTCDSTANLIPGMLLTGPNVAAGTTIAQINSSTSLTLNQAANGTGSALTLTAAGVTLTGCTAGTVPTINTASTTGLAVGMGLTGSGLSVSPGNPTVAAITNSTSFTTNSTAFTTIPTTLTASGMALEFNNGTVNYTDTMATTPVIPAGTATAGNVGFWARTSDLSSGNGWTLQVSPDGGTTWNTRLTESFSSSSATCTLNNANNQTTGSTTILCSDTSKLTVGNTIQGAAITIANCITSTTTNPNVILTANTTGLAVGMFITGANGAGIPNNSRITAIAAGVSFTINNNVTVSNASPGITLLANYLPANTTIQTITPNTSFTVNNAAFYSGAGVTLSCPNHGFKLYHYDLATEDMGANMKLRFQFSGNTATSPARPPATNLDDITVTLTTGAPPSVLTMYDDGAHGDGAAGDGVYGATIPAQANGSSVNFAIAASDSNGAITNLPTAGNYTVAPSPTITTASPLASGNTTAPYSQTLAATGGTPGYTWSLFSGALPAGLSLNSSGTISGTATAGGSFSFVAKVTDSLNRSATKAFAITISIVTLPNVVIIVTDDQGWGDVGYHTPPGQVQIDTPTMDSFATTGIRLERFYCTTVCSVTRSTLMTGRNAIRHGTNNERGLDLSEHLMPQTFKAAGYQTYMCGKWHLGGSDKNLHHFTVNGNSVRVLKEGLEYAPYNRGWDSHYGQYSGAIDYFTHNSAELESLDLPDWWLNGVQQDGPSEHTDSQGHGGWSPDLLADKAISHIQNRDPAKPMLLHVAFNSIHGPVSAPPSLLTKYGTSTDPTHYIANSNRRLIAAAVDGTDQAMGRVLSAIDAAGIANNTLVIWFSDNGGDETKGSLNDPLRGTKGDSYEGGMREPAGIRWPGVLPAGVISNQSMWVGDVFPTICAATGVTPQNTKPFDGVNLWPALQAASNSTVVFRGTPLVTVSATPISIFAFADPVNGGTKDFKLIRNKIGATVVNELYNLTDDPAETSDLSGNSAYASIITTLTNSITAIQVENFKPYVGPPLITNSVAQGSSVTLYAPFTSYPGAAPSIQWRKNGTNLSGGVITQITDSASVAVKATYAATLTLVNVAPGDAGTYDVIVSNNSGSTTSDSGVLTVALGAPALDALPTYTQGTSRTVTWPAVVGATSYTIQRAADSGFSSGLSSQTVSTPTATFSGLSSGAAYFYRATATDGTTTSGFSNIVSSTQDNTNPVVAITAPANGATTNQTTVNVQGTSADGISGIASVTVNGVSATTADNFAHWSVTVPLSIGSNSLTATVTDGSGNTASTSVTITSSPVSPVITAVATGPTAPTYLDPVTVLAQIAPGAAAISTVQLSYDLGTPISTTIFREVFNNTSSNNWNGTGALNSWTTVGGGTVRQAISTSNHTVPISITSAATNGTTTVTCARTANLWPGMLVTGPTIPGSINGTSTGNTTIAAITNATSFELSQASSATGSGLTLTAAGVTLSNCTTVAGTSVTCDSTAGLLNGMALVGTGLANNATVSAVTSATTFTMNTAPTTPGTALTITASGAAAEFNGGTANLTDTQFTTGSVINTTGTAGYVEFWVQTRDLAATNNCQWALQVSSDNGATWNTRLGEDWNSKTINLGSCVLNPTDAPAGSTTVTCTSTTGLVAGQAVTGPNLYVSCGLTPGQSTVTCTNTTGLLPGMFVQGTGIPNNTRIGTITPDTSFTLVTGSTATPVNAIGTGGTTAVAATYFATNATVSSITNTTSFVVNTAAYANTTSAPIAATATTINHGYQLFHYDFAGAELGATTKLRWQATGYPPTSPTRSPRISIDDIVVATTAPAPTTTAAMFDDGLHGDGAAGDGIYGAIIPAQTGGTAVTYRITANGVDGNSTTSANYTFTANSALTDATIKNAEFLGMPTANSVTLNVVAASDQYAYVEYGTSPGTYTSTTPVTLFTIDGAKPEFYNPIEITLSGLQADTKYYYRLRHRAPADPAFRARGERSFRTARPRGSSFVFTVTADPHLDVNSDLPLFTRAMSNIAADQPDLHIDLGDIFMTDKLADGVAGIPVEFFGGVTPNQSRVNDRALFFRNQFERVCHSVPFFYTQGNHESEYGYLFNAATDKENNIPAWNLKARKSFYPTPIPSAFYTGNATPKDYSGGTLGLLENYYAYEWGDALFIALDPYWNTNTSPNQVDDAWQWTLGKPQYDWLKATLQGSTAKYKFVFMHHIVGGSTTLADGTTKNVAGRGGIEVASKYEWGGKNLDGSEGFATKRPGWDMPIHQLLVQNGVNVVFHGHDHLYAYQTLDGMVYLECPQPGTPNFTTLGSAGDGKYTEGVLLPNSGHIRVSVNPSEATVAYVRAYRTTDENTTRHNQDISHSFTIAPALTTPEIRVYDGTVAAGVELQDAAGQLDFGTVTVGSSATRTITILNQGPGTLQIASVTPTGDWSINSTGLSTSLAASQSTSFAATFAPTASGSRSGGIAIATNDADEASFDIASVGTGKHSQTITFGAISPQTCGTPLVLGATASSGLGVSYAITAGSGIATLTNGTLSFSGAGEVTIEASQPGDATYASAAPVQRTFTVAKGEQIISFDSAVPANALTTTSVSLAATSNRGLTPVTYSVFSGPGAITGSTLTFTAAGNIIVRATQAGNGAFSSASADKTITAVSPQTITFAVIPDQVAITPLVVSASSSSGLPVNLTITEGAAFASLTGSTVTFTGSGQVTIEATQGGNGTYAAADPVSRTFQVGKASQIITFGAGLPSTVSQLATITLSASSNRDLTPITFSVVNGPGSITGSSLTFGGTGPVIVRASQAGTPSFLAASADTTFTVVAAPQAEDGSADGTMNDLIQGQLVAHDPDTDEDDLVFSLVTAPTHGSVQIVADSGAYSYQPTPGYLGVDFFTFRAHDGTTASNEASITLNIDPLLPNWAWMAGPNLPNAKGTSEAPGAREKATSWTDGNGRLYVFGGNGNGITSGPGFLGDLFRYDPAAQAWTHLKGNREIGELASYGSPGVEQPTNQPGARSSAAGWLDADGSLWLFGGIGPAGSLADLWKYDPSSNNWTFMAGSTTANRNGTYGNPGIPAPGNQPGARSGAAAWIDPSGQLYLFGGRGLGATGTTVGALNDLWSFNPANLQWTHLTGATSPNAPGVYGTIGVADASSTPGARSEATTWTDKAGNFYLFGGSGLASTSLFADLWCYAPSTNQWRWVRGAATLGARGTYGRLGLTAPTNQPGARAGASSWVDAGGRLWLFGGNGLTTSATVGALSDVWSYQIDTNAWTWVKGTNLVNGAASYGTVESPTIGNTPGGRGRAAEFIDRNGDLWLFGGVSGTKLSSDLWKLDLPALPIVETLDATPEASPSPGPAGLVFHATANPQGTPSTTQFRIATAPDFSDAFTTTSQAIGNGATPIPFSTAISNLPSGTTCYAQAMATNAAGTGFGQVRRFLTAGPARASVVGFTISSSNISEAAPATARITVQLSVPASAPGTVPYTFGGSASPTIDFLEPSSPLAFVAGQTFATIAIPIQPDSEIESAETITLTLGDPSGGIELGSTTEFTLTIVDDDQAPEIGTPPASQFLIASRPAIQLSAGNVTGTTPFRYQWLKNGSPIARATLPTLTIPSSTLGVGTYKVVVTNPAGSRISDAAELSLITITNSAISKLLGSRLSLTTLATSPSALQYEWRKGSPTNSSVVPGGTSNTLVLNSLAPEHAGEYFCHVTAGTISHDSGITTVAVVALKPEITPIDTLPQGQIGEFYRHQVVLHSDPLRAASSFTATGLPAGLSISPTGLISGRPLEAVTGRNVVITARNIVSNSAAEACTLTILGLPTTIPGTYLATGDLNGSKARLDIIVSPGGGFSVGCTELGGTSSATGALNRVIDASGPAPVTFWAGDGVLPTKSRGAVDFELDFNPAAPNEVAGQLLDPVTHQRVGTITGYRLVWSPGTPATSFAGFYTALMPLPSSLQGDQEIPQGTGTLSFIIAPTTGRLSMTAYSAEGVKYTCASLVGANGQLIFFAPLPTISSLLEGSATILPSSGDAFANNSLQGTLSWSKAAVASNSPSRLYRQGFGPIPLDLLGGKYAPPTAGQIIMNLPARVANPNAQLTFTQGGLLDSDISPLDFNLSNPSGATQKATLPTAGGPLNPGKVTFVLAATTGQFTGSITINHPVAALARKVSYQGRITHDSDGYHAGGFFLMPQLPQPGESLKTSPVLSGKAALSPLP